MSFGDPIVGGTTLRIPAEQSPNFDMTAQTGWAIFQDGSAYFFNVTATGVITATAFDGTDFTVDSAGIFFYSGPPATGNLIISIANTAGTDPYNNAYPEGWSIGASGTGQKIVGGVNAGSPLIYFLSAIANALNNAALQLTTAGAGAAAHDTLVIKSSQDQTHTDYVAINLNGNSQDGTTQTTSLSLAYVDTGGTAHFQLIVTAGGVSIPVELTQLFTADATPMLAQTNVTVTSNSAFIMQTHFVAASLALKTIVTGDAHSRFLLDAGGQLQWGPGNTGTDTKLARTAVGVLSVTAGSFSITTIGQGLAVKEGTNAKQGTATLAAGTVTVANTSVTANSRIFLTAQTSGAAPGALRVSARTAGTSFTITSTSATDTSVVAYQIFEPA
jgi:hypothetical protein